MSEKKIQKGRVFIETSKGLFPFDVLRKAELNSDSKQLDSSSRWMAQNGLMEPPYNPKSLLILYESNSVFMRCVNQLASDVAGLGWTIQQKDEKKANNREFDRINEFLDSPNEEDSMREIFKRLLIDWGSIGNFSLEVSRNNKQEIGAIYHVPVHTIKVHKTKQKYCQIRNTKKAWFKKFGTNINISTKTGKELSGRSKDSANELIFCKNYYPLNDYYGVPNVISAAGDIVGLIGCRDYNLAFFENYGIPAGIVILEGDWEEGSDRKVRDFINKEAKGSENAHRTLVVQQPDNCKFKYEKLGVEVKEQSFKLYEKARQEDILIAYSMPPERIGIRVVGKLGGNVAEEATKNYVQSVVEPLQLDIEDMVNKKLLQSEFYEFKFNNIDLRDYDALVDRLSKQVRSAVRTPNEARNELGLKPYAEGDKYYIESGLIEVGEASEQDALAKDAERFTDILDED